MAFVELFQMYFSIIIFWKIRCCSFALLVYIVDFHVWFLRVVSNFGKAAPIDESWFAMK